MLKKIFINELKELNLEQLKDELDFCIHVLIRMKESYENEYDYNLKSNYIREKIRVIKVLIQEKLIY